MEHLPTTPVSVVRLFEFIGGKHGPWRVSSVRAVVGESLVPPQRLDVVQGSGVRSPGDCSWRLPGVTSNERYVERVEKSGLVRRQAGLGRPDSSLAALIPIRKSADWWALTQDERRSIFEAQSKHIAVGMKFLPAVARRLHHCRDLGSEQPFDFLTWFEYSPADEAAFDQLLIELRASPEWRYVEREVEVRVVRDPA